MKKIMFKDEFLLTKAVLEGRKTQTRRLASSFLPDAVRIGYARFEIANGRELRCWTKGNSCIKFNLPYKVGEVVAVAQSYRDCGGINEEGVPMWEIISQRVGGANAGWDNKMFARAELMPHQIRITDVRVERLQDISDIDCLKEGVVVNEPKIKGGINMYYPCEYLRSCAKEVGWGIVFHTPREAFAHLINKVSRKDVWQSNPYVFVYDFELVK